MTVDTVSYRDGVLVLLDQTRLPRETAALECRTPEEVADAIRRLVVRGAPAIGLAAAYGVTLAAHGARNAPPADFRAVVLRAISTLRSARPTAVNLAWALERQLSILDAAGEAHPRDITGWLQEEADRMMREDSEANRAMGRIGAALLPDGANVLTHCNAGALATGAYGTALGVLRAAHESGKRLHVWVDETRPLLQGARLTAWELRQAGIDHTLITDGMAGHFMAQGAVDAVVVGADRIAANGDGANKIGTYSVAVLAHAHDIPFYFVAPTSTVDLATSTGRDIVIEQRSADEVTAFWGMQTAPEGTRAANPAFDVTPARLVTAIVTEHGAVRAPFEEGLQEVVKRAATPAQALT